MLGLHFVGGKAEAPITCPKLTDWDFTPGLQCTRIQLFCATQCDASLLCKAEVNTHCHRKFYLISGLRRDPCHQVSYLAPGNSLGNEEAKEFSTHTELYFTQNSAIRRLCDSDTLITENNFFLLQAPWHISPKFLMSRPLQFQFYPRTHHLSMVSSAA